MVNSKIAHYRIVIILFAFLIFCLTGFDNKVHARALYDENEIKEQVEKIFTWLSTCELPYYR